MEMKMDGLHRLLYIKWKRISESFEQLKQWVPIDKVIVEVANFDIAAMDAYLKDGTILNGKDYQMVK